MPNQDRAAFFLGANTPSGFRSYFEQSYNAADGWRVFIIKGGPGTGKSTLMRTVARLAEERGEACERIYCSSDPDSLDAVILPDKKRAIYDGTAPHVLEPTLPGACERLVDMGRAWDARLLFERREEIAVLSAQCSEHHRRATGMLACAEHFRQRIRSIAQAQLDEQRIDRAAARLSERCGAAGGNSNAAVRRRLAGAVTPKGIYTVAGEYIASFGRVVPIYDRWYAPSGRLLSALAVRLSEKGLDTIECPCSQEPTRLEHILVPEADVCYTVRSDIHGEDDRTENDDRAVHTERFLPAAFARGERAELSQARREIRRFTELAAEEMRRAKTVHDRLEDHYRTAMSFGVAEELAREAAEEMLS